MSTPHRPELSTILVADLQASEKCLTELCASGLEQPEAIRKDLLFALWKLEAIRRSAAAIGESEAHLRAKLTEIRALYGHPPIEPPVADDEPTH